MKKIPYPHCGVRFEDGVRFSPEFLQVKGFAKNLFVEAKKRGITLRGVVLCPVCSAKAQGRAVFIPKAKKVSVPKPTPAPMAKAPRLSGETFLCKGCSHQKPIEGSQTLPKMTRRCADCLPSAKLWWDRVHAPKAKAEPAPAANVVTASLRSQ